MKYTCTNYKNRQDNKYVCIFSSFLHLTSHKIRLIKIQYYQL